MFRILAVLSICAALPVTVEAACQPGPVHYDYQPQRLDQALQDLAHRSGCFIQVSPELLAGKHAHALHGRYRPLPALTKLLQGTGLVAHATGSGLAVTQPAADTPKKSAIRQPQGSDS
ncbi:STN domain-containing protein [Burkholderia glumae]|uniref:STN domain-containing protein n=1 Tax=Burkholderia glumae TaxID=337 RepID=A0AAP9XXL3_BURGL|nr:STN domain-containing protein [Burkholderia glumae]ACR30979.1 Hypothetical protein bglu_2g05360 [Burkholderia glumae BGR1]AJY63205.1 hypothetical protein KS03_5379 [Burkholderia glumae LMG 2196 = ATCC 33617]KHJ63517.1 hypothetical protein NCPPB3923_07710 [Burkholderia glumae]MCM2483706.1 STN domain-containing protein [Burkholderia glumae]MCM2509400.1 STN domain-containing protein [Burkholderia glumae]